MKQSAKDAFYLEKHGVKLHVFDEVPEAGTVLVECPEGHFEEFYHTKSTFIYYVIEGSGTFYLNGEPVRAQAGDLIVAKPNTRIYYLGTMKLLLTNVPAWTEEDEVHVRDIPRP